jgi:DNA-binding NtrC family response regulator
MRRPCPDVVRGLRNAIERACLLSDGKRIEEAHDRLNQDRLGTGSTVDQRHEQHGSPRRFAYPGSRASDHHALHPMLAVFAHDD